MKLCKVVKIVIKILVVFVVVDAGFVLGFPKVHLPPKDQPVDAIIVLGAAPNSPAIRERAWHGYTQYKDGLGKMLVFAGGNTRPQDETEAANMSRFLANRGALAPHALEENSSSTWENLLYTKKELPQNYSVLVVTDTYHIPRAVLVAKAVGFEKVYWSAPTSNYYPFSELVWYFVREMVALPSYLLKILHFGS